MNRINRLFFMLVLAGLIAGIVYAAEQDATVYVTKSGEKYHTERCSSLKSSRIAIPLEEAASMGYEPCRKCKPPVLDDEEYSLEE